MRDVEALKGRVDKLWLATSAPTRMEYHPGWKGLLKVAAVNPKSDAKPKLNTGDPDRDLCNDNGAKSGGCQSV